jgi:hypothetical protein
MPLSQRDNPGEHVGSGGAGFSLTAPGRIYGFLISHAQSTAQSVTFNNFAYGGSGDVLLYLDVAPERSPLYVMLPKDMAIHYDALSITTTYCTVFLWYVPD